MPEAVLLLLLPVEFADEGDEDDVDVAVGDESWFGFSCAPPAPSELASCISPPAD